MSSDDARRRDLVARGLQILLLCVCISAIFVLVAWLPSRQAADQPRAGLGPSIAATAVVALSFGRMKRGSGYVANRIVYGSRATPLEVVSEFTDRIVLDHTGAELVDEMARVIARGTGAERAFVLLVVDGELQVAGVFPDSRNETEPDVSVSVKEGDEELGAFAIWKPRDARVLPSDVKLLNDLASIGGIVLRNLHLQAELLARVDELDAQSRALKASRRRIVEAQDKERKVLERDIHDGTQQYLTALGMKLGHAKIVLAKDQRAATDVMNEAGSLAVEALEAVADLSVSLYPRELIEYGVVHALRRQGGRFAFDVDVSGNAGRYGRELEACIYFTCIEALQNAAKHSQATRVSIEIKERGGEITFSVTDDGIGFDVGLSRGTGLRNMGDRVAAFGGVVEFSSESGRGTRVRGALPLTATKA